MAITEQHIGVRWGDASTQVYVVEMGGPNRLFPFNERWVQDRIAEDPSMLGLGDVVY